MKQAQVYREESMPLIDLYVDMLYHYDRAIEIFENNGCKVEEEFTNKVGAVNMRKTPTLSAIEKLRVDIMSCSDRLLLSPKQLKTLQIEPPKPVSTLEKALNDLNA